MSVEASDLQCSLATILHVKHRVQLLQYLEAVNQLVASRLYIIPVDCVSSTAEVANQRIVKRDDETDWRSLLCRRPPVLERCNVIIHKGH